MLDNVKSKFILKEIFKFVKYIRKLNIIKYNKRIKIKLAINKEDFEIYSTLKKFNIEEINRQEINLNKRYIGNEGLKDLVKISFTKLEVLDLGENKISHINILEKVNFKELKELHLADNNISDIKVLEKVKFEKLELFYLDGNEIDLIKNDLIISKLKSLSIMLRI